VFFSNCSQSMEGFFGYGGASHFASFDRGQAGQNPNPSHTEGIRHPHGSREVRLKLVVWNYPPCRQVNEKRKLTKGSGTCPAAVYVKFQLLNSSYGSTTHLRSGPFLKERLNSPYVRVKMSKNKPNKISDAQWATYGPSAAWRNKVHMHGGMVRTRILLIVVKPAGRTKINSGFAVFPVHVNYIC
jgi:hypothetical protein